jgi:hypothetical protein
MKTKKIIFTAITGLIFSIAANAQAKTVYDTIPFEIVHDKFIFWGKIDGKPVKFILDTGGINLIVSDSANYYGFQPIRTQTIADVGNATMQVIMGSVKNLKLGRRMNWETGKMTTVPNNLFFRELGIVGTIGGEFFSQMCLIIDKRNKRFIISYPYRPPGISRNDGTPMNMGNSFQTVVPIAVGNQSIDIMFDTGKSGFLTLSQKDFEKLNAQPGVIEQQRTGHGMLYVGATGIDNALSDSISKARIPVMTLPGGKEFHNVGTIVGNYSNIFGQELFDYGIVMFDYPRGLFFFFPYEKEPSDMEKETKIWDAKIVPMTDHFEVVAVIGNENLKVGDRVWSINDTKLTRENFSELFVNDVLKNITSDTAEITIGNDEKHLQKVIIKKI